MNDWSAAHRLIEHLFKLGLVAVEPRTAVCNSLSLGENGLTVGDATIPVRGRLIVVAIGKAAGTMSLGAIDALGDRIDVGIALTKDDHFDREIPGFECYEARHPLPDQRGIDATVRILELCSSLNADDCVIALISGGGSALLESPVDGVSLQDFQSTTDLLLRAGAPIQDLNAVRSVISEVKGGGLRRTIGDATCVSLILSDVLGNDPTVIASGPTVPSTPDRAYARTLVERYGIGGALPSSVSENLKLPSAEHDQIDTSHDVWYIVADNRTLSLAIRDAAGAQGLRTEIIWNDVEGEARDLGVRFTRESAAARADIDLLLGGGEATVTVTGSGEGGRNTEFALAAAIELDSIRHSDWVISSLGSDGQDGSADAAGAIADSGSIERALAVGLSGPDLLRDNASAAFFAGAGGLVRTGPTGNNVNDIYIAVRTSAATSKGSRTGGNFGQS